MSTPLRLLAVHAHPDDESSKGAATLARYAAEGVDVLVATCTGGERGDILNPAEDRPEVRADLGRVRAAEMAAAAAVLGARQRFLGFVDSGLPADGAELPADAFARLPVAVAAAPLVALVRELRPQVIVSYDPSGGYPHPDHLMAHRVARHAFDAAADPAAYPGSGPAWAVAKLYYLLSFSRSWFQVLHDATRAAGLPSAMAEVLRELPENLPEPRVTTRVECARYFATRDRALRAHTTQTDPAHPFFAHSREIERRAWPTEDYELAEARVPVSLPEDDLFAGVR
ncbi:mycothiol conjugate amidase Mca [Micromonospora sp. MA102]|uniref:mycothiol conjugate amidase Mca n=1 Tax=Micromonospora sp. MA102 TaxID=2952755 RepID=UPI0021C57DF2|nr:mycothiol conjugate amidase Mca [Micromonospora sp. MA102]